MAPINFLSGEDRTRLKQISFLRSVVFSFGLATKRPERDDIKQPPYNSSLQE